MQLESNMGKVVTIDGPAASGKTSLSRELARRLGWQWVSTGAFYRALAYAAQQSGIPTTNETGLAKLAESSKLWSVQMSEDRTAIFYQGHDVTDAAMSEAVGTIASQLSHFPLVREALLRAQRECSDLSPGLIAEGRDCGTVVFPTAEAKIYLTADETFRAERRAREQGLTTEETAAAQRTRDLQDTTRTTAPLQVPQDALVLDTTRLSLDEVVTEVEDFVRDRLSEKRTP